MTILQGFADYAIRELGRPLPSTVVHHAKRAVVDWFAALFAGAGLPPATFLTEALVEEATNSRAVLYPSGRRVPLRTAALINATASHTAEFDDIFREAIYHPGSVIIPAALAAAQARGASGADLLHAVIVGYEISTRIGATVNPAHYRYWHTTGTIGTLGAAAAVASVLRLDREGTVHALATAGTLAAGLQQAFRSDAMSKALHAGHAADAGSLAALAAEKGLTGASDILEGPRGFGAAMGEGCDWSQALEGLGSRYNITAMTFKNYGCCGHTFAAIDGILALRERCGLEAPEVDRLSVATYGTAVEVAGHPAPQTAFEARFSIPFVIATALVHGSVRLGAFSKERLHDPMVRRLMERIELVVDPELDARFPGQRAATVRVETGDGRRLEHFQPTRKGDPDQPLTDHELADKYNELAAPVLGKEAADMLLASLWGLEEQEQVDLVLACWGTRVGPRDVVHA